MSVPVFPVFPVLSCILSPACIFLYLRVKSCISCIWENFVKIFGVLETLIKKKGYFHNISWTNGFGSWWCRLNVSNFHRLDHSGFIVSCFWILVFLLKQKYIFPCLKFSQVSPFRVHCILFLNSCFFVKIEIYISLSQIFSD